MVKKKQLLDWQEKWEEDVVLDGPLRGELTDEQEQEVADAVARNVIANAEIRRHNCLSMGDEIEFEHLSDIGDKTNDLILTEYVRVLNKYKFAFPKDEE